jgi:hypothetical protein
VLLVDLNENGLQAIESLPVPVFQTLAAVRCSLKDLPETLKTIATSAGASGARGHNVREAQHLRVMGQSPA